MNIINIKKKKKKKKKRLTRKEYFAWVSDK